MKIGIIGLGHWGSNHLNTLLKLDEVSQILVLDPKKINAFDDAKIIKIKSLEDLTSADGVIVASPSPLHFEHGSFLIKNKIPCLIEKPVSLTTKDVIELSSLVSQYKTPFLAGHIENFNPAFVELKNRLKNIDIAEKPLSISCSRLGMSRYNFDNSIDIIFDLMIHDIELIQSIINDNNLASCSATYPDQLSNDQGGQVSALLKFKNGCTAELTSSRVYHKKQRLMTINTSQSCYEIDFGNQSLTKYQTYNNNITSEFININKNQPLEIELKHFLNIIQGKEEPIINIDMAYHAVKNAQKVTECIALPIVQTI